MARLVVLLALVAGCPSSSALDVGIDAPESDGGMDAPALDAPALDTPTLDTAMPDGALHDVSEGDTPVLDVPTDTAPPMDVPADAPLFDVPADAPLPMDVPGDAPVLDVPADTPRIDVPPDAPEPLAPLGTACRAASECESGFCVDGYCCNTSCRGLCQSCDGAFNTMGDGACSPIDCGDPNGECAGTSMCVLGRCGMVCL